MKILMLESRKGTDDGFQVRQFEAGKVYDTEADDDSYIRARTAYRFIDDGRAEELPQRAPSSDLGASLLETMQNMNQMLFGDISQIMGEV